jgi:hypothetical protein
METYFPWNPTHYAEKGIFLEAAPSYCRLDIHVLNHMVVFSQYIELALQQYFLETPSGKKIACIYPSSTPICRFVR